MKPDLSLSGEALEELEALLRSEAAPADGMDIATLDGHLAAIVLNPQLIAPSQWLPWVWAMEHGEDSGIRGYWSLASKAMHTARSTTYGENFGDFLMMAPSCQTKEPPQNPGRFRLRQDLQRPVRLTLMIDACSGDGFQPRSCTSICRSDTLNH